MAYSVLNLLAENGFKTLSALKDVPGLGKLNFLSYQILNQTLYEFKERNLKLVLSQ